MAKLGINAIRELAISIIRKHPGGIRFTPLFKTIMEMHPDSIRGTVGNTIADLEKQCPDKVVKPSRGLYLPAPAESASVAPRIEPNVITKAPVEADFYELFARWLKNDLDEATDAAALGAAGGGKWGTPDVLGVYRSQRSDFIKFEAEIIAAELKTDPEQSIVAFGQAAAYSLFATKSYIVMPNTISEDDKSRLEALCMLHGIGLVLFTIDLTSPDFRISVRAQRAVPDMFYVNQFAERLRRRDTTLFNRLFG